MNEAIDIMMSPLCRSFETEGKLVQIDILGDGDGRWLLEVIDKFGYSTVWSDSFSPDQEAIDTINKEGIGSLIGSPSHSTNQ